MICLLDSLSEDVLEEVQLVDDSLSSSISDNVNFEVMFEAKFSIAGFSRTYDEEDERLLLEQDVKL